MKAAITLATLAALATSSGAQTTNATDSQPLARTPTSLRLSVERIKLSPDERMGMAGMSFLFEAAPHLWVGPAVYGAVTGDRGGFFTGGFEAAWRQPVVANWSIESGLYVGGGGGSTALVGGGLMLRPHLDLMWQTGPYRAGVSLSRVTFPSGSIGSTQAGVVLAVDNDFLYAPTRMVGQSLHLSECMGVGFDRVMGIVGVYKAPSGTVDKAGAPQGKLGYAGFRMEQDVGDRLFWGIEAAGAGSGDQAGYAEFLGTGGVRYQLGDSPITVGARAAAGLGGGGGVSAGGGPLVKAAAFAQAHFARDHSLMLEGGVAKAPDGQFRANFVSVMYAWDMQRPVLGGSLSKIVLNEWELSEQHYIHGARADGVARDLDTIGLKLNRYILNDIYLTGQAHSAYRGGAGGYSVGLFGAGARTSLNSLGTSLSGEMLLGAAGGGGVASGGGAIVQPMAYLRQAISDSVGLKVGVGRVKSLKGSLDSTVVDLSVSVGFGSASAP
jgi:hypothetical protein